ncbi:MAG: DUF819 domain-containing protein [Henriciella sp.]
MADIFQAPLLDGGNVFAMATLVLGLAWFGFWVDQTEFGKKTSGVVWVLIVAMALSNLRLVPFSSPTYDFVGAYLVPASIPLLLYKADLRRVFRDGGPVLLAFSIASIGTILGAITGVMLLDLGDIGAKAAGAYTGGWIGGAVNLVSVSRAVEMTPAESTVVIGASSGVSIIMLMFLMAFASFSFVKRFIPSAIIDEAKEQTEAGDDKAFTVEFKLPTISGALALSFLICAISEVAAQAIGMPHFSILIITAVTLLLANLFPKVVGEFEGDFQLGMFMMYLFFAAIGLGTNVTTFLSDAPVLFFYGLLIMGVHFLVVLTAAKIFKIDLAQAIAGSGAALVGPAVTAAIASTQGWRRLVTPSIMCGVLGYALATFIGVAVSAILS